MRAHRPAFGSGQRGGFYKYGGRVTLAVGCFLMDIVNSKEPERIAEYRRSVVRLIYKKSEVFTKGAVDNIVNNCMLFPALWLKYEAENYQDVPDLEEIFKPYGSFVVHAVRFELKLKRISRKLTKQIKPKIAKPEKISDTFSPKLRWQVMERDGHKCVKCGRNAKDGIKLHVDHIHPKSRGGMTTLDNGQTLCYECNIGKGARVPQTHPTPFAPDKSGAGSAAPAFISALSITAQEGESTPPAFAR
jgi:hypothetical protein